MFRDLLLTVDETAAKSPLLGVPYLSLAENMKQFSNGNNLKLLACLSAKLLNVFIVKDEKKKRLSSQYVCMTSSTG